MNLKDSFQSSKEKEISDAFLKDGYYIFKLEDNEALDHLKSKLIDSILGTEELEKIHLSTSTSDINKVRLASISKINSSRDFSPSLYHLAKPVLDILVGNELVMQRTVNLSIQMPNDDSSLLPIHTDVWSGNSPYEVVLWLPFVNCSKTNSMFILPREKSLSVLENYSEYKDLTTEEFFKRVESDLLFLDVPYGSAVIFSHTLFHGNRTNSEPDTRVSINVRFKSVLSPYGSKGLGESFRPISLKPATQIGLDYQDRNNSL